ncbi:RNA polymerase-associated protein LEO1 [Sorghum bicolor]|uniref:Uncharacterized protein n=1 Tax=Sorghum bicolor TaxID=4558 RepID=C5XKE1_SORBI|nr:RNA polymerase-associated protein LEO1 [Sorghum bicolor]XP_021313328.1 RNA polymerase-associated protein LEO1 [Sorghum bicolor]XP_021313329.1 RNA polymerase-associated protein LEO1 [Sorghum bicolor]EES00045.1 hypothetical protein SORBI_3003G014900 [Sorghum bicolor]KXG31539.1 hypothetical protein SORBI_3003G014900 [Sorghum bicolor]KXG31540.1 hypothetical protein SORBI_3003G014900 [Sorghum bicolor]OQU86096.1 hypothetical protein SORBI_3003G014900 [Sorghum bicolor]OQU86097.1 hypothetical pro|eukprot:XP_002454925.1 RNA polymerase-associated protein LEO1 [Sorghum bicolor]
MDAAAKLPSLYAELAAKSSRVAELEARISALETENAGLREALAAGRREATGSTGEEEEDPISRGLAAGLRGIKHGAVEKRGGGGGMPRDAIEVSDDEEGAAAVGANNGGSGSPEEGVGAIPAAEDAEGGGGSNGESSAGLEDDDVSVTPRGKKRGRGAAATRVVTSDSEDDDDGGDEDGLGSGKDDDGDQEGLMSSRKRAFRRVSDSEDEDGDGGVALHQAGSGEEDVHDMVPIYELLKRVPSEDGDESDEDKGHSTPAARRSARLVKTVPSEDDDKSDEAKGHSAPATRRSARLVKRVPNEDEDEPDEAKGHSAPTTRRSARLVKNQSKSDHVFRGVSDSEDEDGNEGIAAPQAESGHKEVPIYELLKRVPKERASEDDDESDEAKGHATPATRRSARLAKNQSKSNHVFRGVSDSEDEDGNEGIAAPQTESGDEEVEDMVPIYKSLKRMPKERVSEDSNESDVAKGHSAHASRRSARSVKNQSKGRRAACPGFHFVEPPKDVEGSEDDMEEDDDMNEFINDDSSDNAGSAEESCDESDVPSVLNEKSSQGLELSDGEVDYKDVMASIGRKKKAKEWDYEADMLAAFGEHPELCLKAVCAIYRKQTEDEQVEKASLVHNKQGFSHKDAPRGSRIAEFLLDGDRVGPVKKTVSDLDDYDHYAFEFCRKVASHYSKQLFAIYQNKEDPYFHP